CSRVDVIAWRHSMRWEVNMFKEGKDIPSTDSAQISWRRDAGVRNIEIHLNQPRPQHRGTKLLPKVICVTLFHPVQNSPLCGGVTRYEISRSFRGFPLVLVVRTVIWITLDIPLHMDLIAVSSVVIVPSLLHC